MTPRSSSSSNNNTTSKRTGILILHQAPMAPLSRQWALPPLPSSPRSSRRPLFINYTSAPALVDRRNECPNAPAVCSKTRTSSI